MISLLVVVCVAALMLSQYKIMTCNRALSKLARSYRTSWKRDALKEERATARYIRGGALLALVGLIIIRGPLNEFYAVNEAKHDAWVENTFEDWIFVPDGIGPDSNGDMHDLHALVPMCNKCRHHVGTWANPGHGHKLVTKSHPTKGMGLEIFPAELEDRYVRSCPLD